MSKKLEIFYYVLFGVSFGSICALAFLGLLRPPVMAIHLILWTFNGFMTGRNYERKRQQALYHDVLESYSNIAKAALLIHELDLENKSDITDEEIEGLEHEKHETEN